jgi:MYXO-CTERM domain-containing protein
MVSRYHLLAGTALAATLAATDSARADLIHWTVSGSFDDGGTFSGGFDYDTVGNALTAWNVSTTAGTSGVGAHNYTPGTGTSFVFGPLGNVPEVVETLSGGPLPNYGIYAFLEFDDVVSATPGTVALQSGIEVDSICANGCGLPLARRDIVSGTAVGVDASAVPEPASGALALAGVGLLGIYRRRRRAC